MNLQKLSGKRLAVLMLRRDMPPGHDFVVHGTAYWTGKNLILDRGENTVALPVPNTALERILPMSDEVRAHLGDAHYWVWLSIEVEVDMPAAQA